jgi:hypothetical protein
MNIPEHLFFFVIFMVWLTFALGSVFWVFAEAKAIYVAATEGLHRRRMEMMDKLIEMERAKAFVAAEPRTGRGGGQ